MKFVILALVLVTILELTNAQECDPTFEFRCDNGNCVRGTKICNGMNDCGDMSDEKGESGSCPSCPTAMHPCNNGRCTYPDFLCDGWNDCHDNSDEWDENGNCPECPALSFKCRHNNRCVLPTHICDGWNDCYDWYDESEEVCPCADNEYRCSQIPGEEDGPAGDCIPEEWVCDEEGIEDCPIGDDEANCTVRGSTHNHKSAKAVHEDVISSKRNKNSKRITRRTNLI